MAQQGKTSSGGFYIWPSPDRAKQQRFWGVTKIIDKGIPKEALKWWAAKATAEWAVDNLATLTTLTRSPIQESFAPIALERVAEHAGEDGTIDPRKLQLLCELARTEVADAKQLEAAREEAIDLAKGAHRRTTKRAALKGTHVHKAAEAYHLQKPYPGVPAEVADQYSEFLRFLNDHRPIIEQTEASIFNRERSFAGTLDGIGLFPTLTKAVADAGLFEPTEEQPYPRLLFDVKTTGSGIYPEVGLQLAAYARGEFIGGPDGSEHPLPKIDAAVVLWLPAGGDYELIPVSIHDEVFRVFLYAYEILRWFEETSKNVIKGALPRPMLSDPEDEFLRLREFDRADLLALTRSRRLLSVAGALDAMDAEELALAIVWDRETPAEVMRYAPTEPCPACGWQVEKVRHRNANTPKWRCINDACTGGKESKGRVWPWASWETEWKDAAADYKPGETPYLQPIVEENAKQEPEAAETVEKKAERVAAEEAHHHEDAAEAADAAELERVTREQVEDAEQQALAMDEKGGATDATD